MRTSGRPGRRGWTAMAFAAACWSAVSAAQQLAKFEVVYDTVVGRIEGLPDWRDRIEPPTEN